MITPGTGGETEIVSKVAVSLLTEIFKNLISTVQAARGEAVQEIKSRDLLGKAAAAYAAQFEARYGSMRVLGMTRPIPLRSVYVRIHFLEKITRRLNLSLDELETLFDRDKRKLGIVRDTTPGWAVVKQEQKLLVLGKPGAGKTTFLRYLGLQALDGNFAEKRIPIFVSLKDWSDSGWPLQRYITEQFSICGLPEAAGMIERALKAGKCLILLDGLDEVTSEPQKAVLRVRDFVDKHNKNQFVMSCRIAAHNYVFEQFTDAEVADFNEEQVQQFIANWFGAGTRKTQQCWHELRENTNLMELASVPLLLTMLCLAYEDTMRFPPNRYELYKDAIDALLKKWDASRSIDRHEPYKALSLRHKEAMLSRMAMENFEAGRYFISHSMLLQSIGGYFAHIPAIDSGEDLDPAAILNAIEAQHGLIVERARGIYSYSHLTLQEYFTAKYIVDFQVRGTVSRLISEHLLDPRWREVILLVSGMLADADDLIAAICGQVEMLESDVELQQQLALLDEYVAEVRADLDGVRHPSVAVASESAPHVERAIFCVRALASLMVELSESFASRSFWKSCMRDTAAWDVPPHFVFHTPVRDRLEKHHGACRMLSDCLEAAGYITRSRRLHAQALVSERVWYKIRQLESIRADNWPWSGVRRFRRTWQ